MNAINDNNDPFEDIFRDRFADFESEPDEILWNKIEPQLPVKPTRRFPYWQFLAMILGLFLGGIYLTWDKEFATITNEQKNLPTINNFKNSPSELLTTNQNFPLHRKRTDSVFKDSSIPTVKGLNPSLLMYHKIADKTKYNVEISDNQGNKVFNEPVNTKINIQKVINEQPSFVASNNIFSNQLNPLQSQSSNPTNTAKSIFEPNNKDFNSFINSGNILEPKYVTYNNQTVIEHKKELSIIDSKSYSLLANHFKAVKLKLVIVPKEEVYFKEKKPLEFYLSAMPLLNYYTITPNGNDANFVHNISVNDDGDRIGFYTQAGLVFTLSDRLKLRTGLTFTKTNHSISYRVRTDSLIVQSPDNQGVDVSFADLNKTYSQTANYLGTKVELQYVFLRGEALTHYLSIGGEGAYRLNGNNDLNGFANFAYGVTRQIGDNAYLFIEPTFSYSLNHQSDNNSLLLVKPNKIGFNIGINFKIK